jgi:arginase
MIVVHQIPYDSGHRGMRMGAGPLALVEYGLLDRLRTVDRDARFVVHEADAAFRTEIGTAFELHRKLAEAVAQTLQAAGWPLILSGNCNSSIGVVAALLAADPTPDLGVLWLDGHGDCNTPETFTGDFLDAMGLSTITGRCWQALNATVPGFRPIPDERCALLGAHGADAGAVAVLKSSAIRRVPPAEFDALPCVLEALFACGVRRLYLHLDIDVLDAATVGLANAFAPKGGLSADRLRQAMRWTVERLPIAAMTVASYDPALDVDGGVRAAAFAAVDAVVGGVRGRRRSP